METWTWWDVFACTGILMGGGFAVTCILFLPRAIRAMMEDRMQ